jgi:hypothetical protein
MARRAGMAVIVGLRQKVRVQLSFHHRKSRSPRIGNRNDGVMDE